MSIAIWISVSAPIVLILAVLNIAPLRRRFLSRWLLKWFRSVLPPISDTENAAIEAGSVWWDRELFTGRPRWQRLLDSPAAGLTDEEQAFIDGPLNELCGMLDDWQINREIDDLPEPVWQYLKEQRFFGMNIPKRFGGLGFSPRAQSEVVMKIATRSVTAAVTVMVPNSLGPGELLLHYGTAAQRDRYLPRLATGEDIPAFALTSTWAGSDAASMIDKGIVVHGEHEGCRVLGLRLNWDKRYITLAPVCTVLGLAFKARDPDGLLGERVELGITCALIPTDLPGVEIGDRHYPGMSFQNGPTRGKDVFIPMDFVVGGREQVGQGWRMLMDCLAVGRAISLPALGVAAGKLCCHTTGAYARVRRQFRVPIGRFEGVQEALARIAGETWRMNAGRIVTADALNRGEKPSILSAILKYHNTEGMRRVVGHAMDIHGGRAVCDGPANYLRSLYDAVPFAITVEGANILTRSLIIFGQGAIRCHPYLLTELRAAANADEAEGLRDFDAAFFAHLGHTLGNAVRAFMLGITGARFTGVANTGLPPRYLRQMTRFSAAFAVIGDVAMLVLAGDLKRRETLSARLGDVLSHLYLASAVVKHHVDNGAPEADRAVVEWALQDSLASIEERLGEFLDNFPNEIAGRLLKWLVIPFGRAHFRPSDALGRQVADKLLEPSETRERLTEGVYFATDENDPVGVLELALEAVVASDAAEDRIRKAYGRDVNAGNLEEFLGRGVAEGVIGETEAADVRRAMSLTERVLAVDRRDRLAPPG